jgi:hypothetical protein
MPNRILKDSICTSDNLDRLTPAEEVFWYRLLVQCDDYGRMDARPAILRSRCYPLRLETVSDQDVSSWLASLLDAGLITLYEIDSKHYLQIITWQRHQQQRAKRSKYPAPEALPPPDSIGNHLLADAPVIQSNPNRESESESLSNAPAAREEDPPPASEDPNIRAVNNAYAACGLMISKTHLDAHLDTIKRTGLTAWQSGWAAAMEVGKQNRPAYVARCAESAMLAEQKSVRSNGHGKSANSQSNFGLASLTTDADRAYHAANSPEAIAALQAEFDAARAARAARGVS